MTLNIEPHLTSGPPRLRTREMIESYQNALPVSKTREVAERIVGEGFPPPPPMIPGNRNLSRLIPPLILGASVINAAELPPVADGFDFHRDIRPILETSCVSCHGPRQQKGKFRLDSAEHLRKGGESGAPFANGKSEESDFIQRVSRLDPDDWQ